MLERKSRLTFLIGLVPLLIAYFLPASIIDLFPNIKPMGIATLIICPLLGILGIIFAIREKSLVFALLNGLLILSFPIVMSIGYFI